MNPTLISSNQVFQELLASRAEERLADGSASEPHATGRILSVLQGTMANRTADVLDTTLLNLSLLKFSMT